MIIKKKKKKDFTFVLRSQSSLKMNYKITLAYLVVYTIQVLHCTSVKPCPFLFLQHNVINEVQKNNFWNLNSLRIVEDDNNGSMFFLPPLLFCVPELLPSLMSFITSS